MKLLIEELPETSVVSIGHRPGLEVFHTRELTLEPGADGTRLRSDAGKRSLGDLYRKMAAASRSTPRDPGFWAHVRASLLGR